MALSDSDVDKQINHMKAFILQEANEKAEEIDAKAEEEFNFEKGRLVQQGRIKIMEYYDRKEKQIDLQKKIQNSNMLNQARLRVLKSREDHLHSVLDAARAKLRDLRSDQKRYRLLLHQLILQGVYQLLETKVVIRCRQDDVQLIESILPEVAQAYQESAKREVELSVDRSSYLSDDDASGGVEMIGKSGKIRLENTLESRLEMVSQEMLPVIREALFGGNPNRKYRI